MKKVMLFLMLGVFTLSNANSDVSTLSDEILNQNEVILNDSDSQSLNLLINDIIQNQDIKISSDDGLVCSLIAEKVRDMLEDLDVFSDETLDKVEEAVEAICDELL